MEEINQNPNLTTEKTPEQIEQEIRIEKPKKNNFVKILLFLVGIIFFMVLGGIIVWLYTEKVDEKDQMCGGIAGISCPDGYKCRLDGNYPDASGICVRKWSSIFKNINSSKDEQVSKPSPTPIVESEKENDQTADWKTYKNEEYGFEFKYPNDLNVEESKGSEDGVQFLNEIVLISDNDRLVIEVRNTQDKQKELEYQRWREVGHSTDKIEREIETKIDEFEAVVFEFYPLISEGSLNKKYIVFTDGYILTLVGKDGMVDQIISTFKIIEEEETGYNIEKKNDEIEIIPISSTEGWKDVSYEGINFKIPKDYICSSSGKIEEIDDSDCQIIYSDKNAKTPSFRFIIYDYAGGSRRVQYCNNFEDTCNNCKPIYKEAYFGDIKALQIATDGAWCYNTGGIVSVIRNKLVVMDILSYSLPDKEIDRLAIKDTIFSTLH